MTKKISLSLVRAQPHYAVGLMSGTSHDGVSAALVTIDDRRSPPVRLIAFATFPYARERRRLEAERRNLDAMMTQLATYAEQRANALGLELHAAFTQGDNIGLAVVLNFNRKDTGICNASKIDLFVERLEALIDNQPDIADGDEPTPD